MAQLCALLKMVSESVNNKVTKFAFIVQGSQTKSWLQRILWYCVTVQENGMGKLIVGDCKVKD